MSLIRVKMVSNYLEKWKECRRLVYFALCIHILSLLLAKSLWLVAVFAYEASYTTSLFGRITPSRPHLTGRKTRPQHRELPASLFANSSLTSLTSRSFLRTKILRRKLHLRIILTSTDLKVKHLLMKFQRQHFLLSYLETLSVVSVRIWTHSTFRKLIRNSANRANQSAVW